MTGLLVAALAVALASCATGFAQYSWQEPHARVLAQADLEWTPRPFVFQKGESVHYIDFENGDDDNNGLTKQTPRKHHPSDRDGTGRAAEESFSG